MSDPRERLILALDVPSEAEAHSLVSELRGHVGLFKIGLELFSSAGTDVVRSVAGAGGGVFLDLKLHDIPNTVAGAARAIARLNVAMFTVHALGGKDMMRAAVEAAREEAARLSVDPPQVIAVTVLTSVDAATLSAQLRVDSTVEDYVTHLAELAAAAGVDGVVSSPLELSRLKKVVPSGFRLVTPGVRPAWASLGDQRRVASPGEAIRQGATHLVLGRPIRRPPKEIGTRVQAAEAVLREIAGAEREESRPQD